MSVPLLFWDVDTQHDFIDPDGRLAVSGAGEIVANLEGLTRFAVQEGIPILASADAHVEDDEEFEEFPPHCVAGTPGQKKIPQTSVDGCDVAIDERLEGQIEALRSGTLPQLIVEKQKLDVFTQAAAHRILSSLRPERVVVYGVATEYCVRRAVLGIRTAGFAVVVVDDAIRAVDEDAGRQAVEEMKRAGARFARARSILTP